MDSVACLLPRALQKAGGRSSSITGNCLPAVAEADAGGWWYGYPGRPSGDFSIPVSGSRTLGTGIFSCPGTSNPILGLWGIALNVGETSQLVQDPFGAGEDVEGKPTRECDAVLSVAWKRRGSGTGDVLSALGEEGRDMGV